MRIREARLARGMTQKELAKKVGVSEVAVSYWENGQAMPQTARLRRIAGVLGVTIDDLLA